MASSSEIFDIRNEFSLLWVDGSVDLENPKEEKIFKQLKSVVQDIYLCENGDQCIRIVHSSKKDSIIIVIAKYIAQVIVPQIHDLPQIHSIYIYCNDPRNVEAWASKYSKIMGLHSDVMRLRKKIEIDIESGAYSSFNITSLDSGQLNKGGTNLRPDFIYSLLLKEALIDIEYDKDALKRFLKYHKTDESLTTDDLTLIEELRKDYQPEKSIEYYARQSFIYQKINFALRSIDGLALWMSGFFIRDLHLSLKKLHEKQFEKSEQIFTVYRGQQLSERAYKTLLHQKCGIIHFNSFLSTSKTKQKAIEYAKFTTNRKNIVSVLFIMKIDPKIHKHVFANISQFSPSKEEEEILFTTNSIFNVKSVEKQETEKTIVQVELELIGDIFYESDTLLKTIREECEDRAGLHRFAYLLIKLGQVEAAELVYQELLEEAEDDNDRKSVYYNDLGCIKDEKGDYEEALQLMKNALKIEEGIFFSQHPRLAITHNNIGNVLMNLEKYDDALDSYFKAKDIQKLYPGSEDLNLSITFNSIGLALYNLGYYDEALSYFKQSLEIKTEILVDRHESIGKVKYHIGLVYLNLGKADNALQMFNEALEIYSETVPESHPDLMKIHSSIAMLHIQEGNQSEANGHLDRAENIGKDHSRINRRRK